MHEINSVVMEVHFTLRSRSDYEHYSLMEISNENPELDWEGEDGREI